jgi:hypothetical protein
MTELTKDTKRHERHEQRGRVCEMRLGKRPRSRLLTAGKRRMAPNTMMSFSWQWIRKGHEKPVQYPKINRNRPPQ